MAEGIRTDDGHPVWVVHREDSEGQESHTFVRRAEDDEVQGHGGRFTLSPEGEDDEVQGHGGRFTLSPEPIDPDQGLYLAAVDTEHDVSGQAVRRPLGQTEEDVEGQVYRQREPRGGGEDGKGSV